MGLGGFPVELEELVMDGLDALVRDLDVALGPDRDMARMVAVLSGDDCYSWASAEVGVTTDSFGLEERVVVVKFNGCLLSDAELPVRWATRAFLEGALRVSECPLKFEDFGEERKDASMAASEFEAGGWSRGDGPRAMREALMDAGLVNTPLSIQMSCSGEVPPAERGVLEAAVQELLDGFWATAESAAGN